MDESEADGKISADADEPNETSLDEDNSIANENSSSNTSVSHETNTVELAPSSTGSTTYSEGNAGMVKCTKCNCELDPVRHKFCFNCGTPVNMEKASAGNSGDDIRHDTPPEPQSIKKVTVSSTSIELFKKHVDRNTLAANFNLVTNSQQQSPSAPTVNQGSTTNEERDEAMKDADSTASNSGASGNIKGRKRACSSELAEQSDINQKPKKSHVDESITQKTEKAMTEIQGGDVQKNSRPSCGPRMPEGESMEAIQPACMDNVKQSTAKSPPGSDIDSSREEVKPLIQPGGKTEPETGQTVCEENQSKMCKEVEQTVRSAGLQLGTEDTTKGGEVNNSTLGNQDASQPCGNLAGSPETNSTLQPSSERSDAGNTCQVPKNSDKEKSVDGKEKTAPNDRGKVTKQNDEKNPDGKEGQNDVAKRKRENQDISVGTIAEKQPTGTREVVDDHPLSDEPKKMEKKNKEEKMSTQTSQSPSSNTTLDSSKKSQEGDENKNQEHGNENASVKPKKGKQGTGPDKTNTNDEDSNKQPSEDKSTAAQKKPSEDKSTAEQKKQTLLAVSKGNGAASGHDSQTARNIPSGHFYMKEKQDTSKTRGIPGQDEGARAKTNNYDQTVTVVFHAILSSKFKANEHTRIFIEGALPIFNGWNEPALELQRIGFFNNNKDEILYGHLQVSLRHIKRTVAYKYVVVKNGNKSYEELVEFLSVWNWSVINRAFTIPNHPAPVNNAILNKFDGFVYPKPGRIWSISNVLENRKDFVRYFFPKWAGFYVTPMNEDLSPMAAVQQLLDLAESISAQWIMSNNVSSRRNVDKLFLSEVIRDFLIPKIHANSDTLANQSNTESVVAAALSSLVIIHVFNIFKIPYTSDVTEAVLKSLKLTPDQALCESLMKEMGQCDQTFFSDLTTTVFKFYQGIKVSKFSILNWLQALPLIHFLRKDSIPFKELAPEKSINYSKWKWWGLDSLNPRECFGIITASQAIEILPDLQNLFSMDSLLSRSFLLLCPVETYGDLLRNKQFTILEVCASLRKLLPERKSLSDDLVDCLSSLFSEINKILAETSVQSLTSKTLDENHLLLETFVRLVENMKTGIKLPQMRLVRRLIESLFTLVFLQDAGIKQEDSSDEMVEDTTSESKIDEALLKFVREACGIVKRAVKDKCHFSLEYAKGSEIYDELQAWNELLSVKAPDLFDKLWHTVLMNYLNDRVKKVSSMRVIEIFCHSDEQDCHPRIAKCLSDAAFKAVDDIVRPGQGEQVIAFQLLSDKNNARKCASLLDRMLEKAWPLKDHVGEEADTILLNHLLTWPTWPGFLTFFGSGSDKKVILPEESRLRITQAESFLENLFNTVESGKVTVSTLKTLREHAKQFLSLADIFQRNQDVNVSKRIPGITSCYKQRINELHEFDKQKKQLTYFIELCGKFKSVDEMLAGIRIGLDVDFSSRSICDLCARTSVGFVFKLFDLPPEIQDMVKRLHDIQGSQIFHELWKKYSDKYQESVVTLDVILNAIYNPLLEELKTIQHNFINGDMLLQDVTKLLNVFDKQYKLLETELEKLLQFFPDPQIHHEARRKQLHENIKKVEDCNKLFAANQAARVILQLKEQMGLNGDFAEVETISKVVGKGFSSQPIKSVSKSLLDVGKLLENITPKRAESLNAFTRSEELVKWLRENIQDQQQLKVFVDLAMISAGESDVEIDRISFMHTSCLGFSSLIFNLKIEHGFRDLMRLCKPVWQAVDANESLSKKLEDTCRYLSWLEQIKKSHGSVALTTLMQVEAINARGIYHIANRELIKSKNGDHGPCLANTVCLFVPEDGKKTEERIYSLDEVKDLQSKLMLIAGKAESGKEEVDQFLEIFEGILLLGDLYVQLCEVGEITYLTWQREFHCKKNNRETLMDDIHKTCTQMGKDLAAWKDQVDLERAECYSLNYYTMKQILKLRKDLASACTGLVSVDKIPLQTFMLLQGVCKSVEPVVLASILEKAIPDSNVFFSAEGHSDDQSYFGSDEEDQSLDEAVNMDLEEPEISEVRRPRRQDSTEMFESARRKLESMGYEEEVAIAALGVCGRNAAADDLVMWVSNEHHDEDEIDELYREALDNPELRDLLVVIVDVNMSDIEVLNDEQSVDETEEISLRYTTELSRPTKPRSTEKYVKNESDTFLALPILAYILELLFSSEENSFTRNVPSYLKKGEPNLILVPRGEIFGSILTLFMGDGNENLPTNEEVVVCNNTTTPEEIELLWRRAVVDKHGLLFCLANADLLDYDVSQQAFRTLERLTQGKSDYHVVVICSTENEDRAHMVASLDQFRCKFPVVITDRVIQGYLKKQLTARRKHCSTDHRQWAPAASVDKDCVSIRVVQSSRAGVGKSLVVKRLARKVKNLPNNKKLRSDLTPSFPIVIPVHGLSVDCDEVTRALLGHTIKPDIPVSRLFHLDISQSVVKELDTFLFKLLILGTIEDLNGNVWRRSETDMYVVEMTTDKTFTLLTSDEPQSGQSTSQKTRGRQATSKYSFLKYLPRTHCLAPRETLYNMMHGQRGDTEFDLETFYSLEYQRVIGYLINFHSGRNLDDFTSAIDQVENNDGDEALKIIIQYCGIRDPSWAELHHFVNFLNSQLQDCEESIFCNTALVGDLLQGFRTFVVRFLIQMSRDFATRSLSDNKLTLDDEEADGDDDLAPFQIRRRWELSPHPYIFFNQDRNSMTFLGFLLSSNGDLLNPSNNVVLEPNLMNPTLRGQLKHQGVDFDQNYEKRDRMTRIHNLCSVMGIEFLHDPDKTYELTTDNVEKILAIHMRFRCGIPVIIMGETGCGKTRLIKFMCELQSGPDGPKNMLLMKVHGGTTYKDIESKVLEAETFAAINSGINVDTVLFFDEANTTDAIDLIKEIMVDRRVNGRAINSHGLHFIAACNPYRKHTQEMIQKLENAGLGYHVSAHETEDKLGSIPLRQLVYRVHPLPESMRPLVWDFGQLTDHAEELYTKQIVKRFFMLPTPRVTIPATAPLRPMPPRAINVGASTSVMSTKETATGVKQNLIPGNESQASCIASILSASQKYMRKEKNECSFVSLRDVERAMHVITWFYQNAELISEIMKSENDEPGLSSYDSDGSDESDEENIIQQSLDKIVRAVVLGIGVCYYARLHDRDKYCRYIARYFNVYCPLHGGDKKMKTEITRCQRSFLDEIELADNIAKNIALSENVFMMAICAELRIPLFVVGKPGSSKSLAKDVVSTHMKGDASQSKLFKNLKEIHMQSYQCSPLSTAEGIVSTFRQCSKLQQDKDLTKYVSVVVLDEIGLAEDSPLMPLKTLHPLLEDGTATEDDTSKRKTPEYLRVGFIGLSNWALDPAKMNRGLMLSRGVPTTGELRESAKGICSGKKSVLNQIENTINKLSEGYDRLYKQQKKSKTLELAKKEEFFGLRDFYSLVKMIYSYASEDESNGEVTDIELEQAIRRNFSGLEDIKPMAIFSRCFPRLKHCVKYPSPECFPVPLIEQSLARRSNEGESRYLLVLTENYAALKILQEQFFTHSKYEPVIIFGSSFPKDQHYTQICRNINRIKICMETGQMVVLLNLESLYESLYDALNQYYLKLGDQKYVDLGLGNHRVKCRVADNFKLIVVAEKDVVYHRFPIPLINRLEKHFLVMSTHLKEEQTYLVEDLETWVKNFSDAKYESGAQSSFKPGDSFVGYHSDTAAAVILTISKYKTDYEQVLDEAKYILLQCASPDAVARLKATELKHNAEELWNTYFQTQRHGSLADYLQNVFIQNETRDDEEGILVQITTHSRLLSQSNAKEIAKSSGFPGSRCRCISLQEFHTEQQFTKAIEEFFLQLGGSEGVLLIQCDNGEVNFNLIACCRYLVVDTRRRTLQDIKENVKPIHVVFIIQVPKIAGGCQNFVGFQGGKWLSVHIDELRETSEQLPRIDQLVNRSVSELLRPADYPKSDEEEKMDVDDDPENSPLDEPTSSADLPTAEELNPNIIIRNCLQSAIARIYDKSADINRATGRIDILLKLLPQDGSYETDLSRVLVRRVYDLLKQKDENAGQDPAMWLQNEALCRARLQETGTFKKALWQKISSVVSPILSEVVAFADYNQNLNLAGVDSWQSRLWMAILNDLKFSPLSYDSFVSPVSHVIRERVPVVNTGLGHQFEAKFPFSWIIYNMVNVLIIQAEAEKEEVLKKLRGIIEKSPLGILLRPVLEDPEIKEQAMMAYLHDFLHTVYKPTVDDEIQLVFDAVLVSARKINHLLNPQEEFELDIALIHFTYSIIHTRLSSFADLVHAFPVVVLKLLRQQKNLNADEMNIDVAALDYCLKDLEPTRMELEQSNQRLIWCNGVQSIRPTVQIMTQLADRTLKESQHDMSLDSMVCNFGEVSLGIVKSCRLNWIRLGVVRLFIEHTCPSGTPTHAEDAQNPFRLWKALGENPDFSSIQTMEVLERFLKECSETVRRRCTKFDISQCPVCMRPLQEPVMMPCKHLCCKNCVTSWLEDHDTCPSCRQQVGEHFTITIDKKISKAIEVLDNFRTRCKSFFMELVSLYCFGEESLQVPSPELVQRFIQYVIKEGNKTEDFSPFGGQAVDVTPVVRSFILQQLLANSKSDKPVYGHLEDYLKRAGNLATEREHMIEVCVLCVQCMEDTETTKLVNLKEAGEDSQFYKATTTLERSLQEFSINRRTKQVFDVNSLQAVAATRAALNFLWKYLDENFSENLGHFEHFQKFLQAAKRLCDHQNRSSIRLFLLKQLVRKYGIDVVKERCKDKHLEWMLPPQPRAQNVALPDSFIVHHDNYKEIRECLAKAILTNSTDELELVIQNLVVDRSARDCYILLALFREVTTSYGFNNIQERIAPRVLGSIAEFIAKLQNLSNPLKPLAKRILTNTLHTQDGLLSVHPTQNASQRRLAEVLMHYRIVLECLPTNALLQPLRNLATNPAIMATAFLPTMPHDYGVEAMQVNLGRWYECPNGHRYVITECGRPNQSYNCPACGSAIGGAGHALAGGNRDATRQDTTKTGHIIGAAEVQNVSLTSERELTPLAFGVLRFLTHAAMLLGTDQNDRYIAAIIKPVVPNVIQFLHAHLEHDIRCLAQSTGHNNDEAMMIIHLVLTGIIEHAGQQQQGNPNTDATLSSKESRSNWENTFMLTYLNPVLSTVSQKLQDSFGRMVRDERLGNDPLMRQLYELDTPNYDITGNLDPMCPALWRYRTRVTIEHLNGEFQQFIESGNGSNKCKVLAEFLKKEHHLRALQYLPDIFKFQRKLSEKFHRRLDRSEAEKFTVGDFKRSRQMKKEISALFHSFRLAWKLVRGSLSENGRLSIPKELCALEVTNDTPIAMFLPSSTGYGRCALALTSFLITLHNEFIGRCKSLLGDESTSDVVPHANVTKTHLVAYDPEKDLLPIILAHCDYSLKVGEGTLVEYNWKALERQLVDRFIRGRPRLTPLVELFVFSKDICDGEVFSSLKRKIPQVELSRPVQDQILNEMKQLTDICDVLKSLQIAIGFLSSAGGQRSMSLSEYLHTGLKLSSKNGLKSPKADQFCQLQHIISLWKLLSLERARILTSRKQDSFDDVSEKIKQPLSKEQIFELSRGLQKINVDRFVMELLEVILLYLKHVQDDQLHWPISEYLNAKLEEKECDPIDDLEEHIPENIVIEHAVETWKIACQKREDYHATM